jgi:hypothetical protein
MKFSEASRFFLARRIQKGRGVFIASGGIAGLCGILLAEYGGLAILPLAVLFFVHAYYPTILGWNLTFVPVLLYTLTGVYYAFVQGDASYEERIGGGVLLAIYISYTYLLWRIRPTEYAQRSRRVSPAEGDSEREAG